MQYKHPGRVVTAHQAHPTDNRLHCTVVGPEEGTPNQYQVIASFLNTVQELPSINFQNGPVPEDGLPNGYSIELLLAICKHRLEYFQSGKFPSTFNDRAIIYIEQALAALHERTNLRIEHNVEGKLEADPAPVPAEERIITDYLIDDIPLLNEGKLELTNDDLDAITEGLVHSLFDRDDFEFTPTLEMLKGFYKIQPTTVQQITRYWLPLIKEAGWYPYY